jgi:hypothetical protein
MNSTMPEIHTSYSPNTDQLRRQGWAILAESGPYCTAWKGSQEVLLIWRDGTWKTVSGLVAMPL